MPYLIVLWSYTAPYREAFKVDTVFTWAFAIYLAVCVLLR